MHGKGDRSRSADNELVEDSQPTDLGLPFSSSPYELKKDRKKNGRSPNIHRNHILPDSLDGGRPGGRGLVSKIFKKTIIDTRWDKYRFQCFDSTGFDEGVDTICSSFPNSGIFFVGKGLDNGLSELDGAETIRTMFLGNNGQGRNSRGANIGIANKKILDVKSIINSGDLERCGSRSSDGRSGDGWHFYMT